MANDLSSEDVDTNHESTIIQSEGLLFDIAIECSVEDAANPTLEGLQMAVVDAREQTTDAHPLDRTSPTVWEYQGIIELYRDMGHLLIIVQSTEAGDFGFLDLTGQISHYLGSQDVSQADVSKHKIVTNEGKPLLWMTYVVSRQDLSPLAPGFVECSKTIRADYREQILPENDPFGAGATLLHGTLDTGSVPHISNAIENLQSALAFTPEGHPNRPARLASLGASFLMRFKQTGDPDDIVTSIEYLQKSAELFPEGHSILPACLTFLGDSFLARFKQTGNLADIAAAIEHSRKSVVLISEGNPLLPSCLNNLGNAFFTRFEQTGNLTDLTTAIEHFQKSAVLTPESHSDAPIVLNSLGNSFSRRFERTGDLADIAAAIEHYQKSVRLSSDGHPNLPTYLNNLARSFATRYERTKDLDDLAVGIELQQRSLKLVPEGHPVMQMQLNNLGSSLSRRFEKTGNLDDIAAAIQHYQKLLALTPKGHPEMPMQLNNLANSLLARSTRTGDVDHITAAIELHQRSVDLTPERHPAMPMQLSNLGNSFWARFKQTGDLADISAAIDNQQKAAELSPEGHADKSQQRSRLGGYFMARFKRTNNARDYYTAARNFRLAAIQNTGKPTARLAAAREWGLCCGDLRDPAWPDAYGTAVELLSLVASLDQTIHRRHSSLYGTFSLTREAVAFALFKGSNDIALEWFEQGRCITWSQLNQLRTPVDLLRQHDAQLAERFLAVSNALETSGSRSQSSWTENSTITQQIEVEDQTRSQLKLAREFEQLLIKIRGLSNFKDFLLPPKAANILSQLPTDGPVVVINIYRSHCDALALINGVDDPIHIPLKNFHQDKAELLRRQLGHHLTCEKLRMRDSDSDRGGRLARRSDTGLCHILRELWNSVAWPILQGLGYSSMPAHHDRNRIWWCLTGPLAFLPVHAAGIYDPNAKVRGPCISDFAVSSYIPTVTTLFEKLRNNALLKQQETKILLLSQPNALPNAPIPGTIDETRTIFRKLREGDMEVISLEDEEGTKSRVTKEMGTHSWVHIASHASQHPTEPLKSGFYLHDGQLELLEIIRQRLHSAEFAYLSACQTSVGDENLSEEAVHLAGGLLAAGYQGVVATMWSIKDQYAPKIAEDFYGYLLREMRERGAQRLDSRQAANALDDATRKIREKLGDSEYGLSTWVPYIHIGL